MIQYALERVPSALGKPIATLPGIQRQIADKAMRIAGGASISRGLPLERLFRDTRAGTMHPPSGDLALETVGRAAIESSHLRFTIVGAG